MSVLVTKKPNRTIVRVISIDQACDQLMVACVIIGWNPHQTVRFPASLIPESIRSEDLRPGTRFFALVNTEAEKAEDLYLDKFELAPEPDEDDGLA